VGPVVATEKELKLVARLKIADIDSDRGMILVRVGRDGRIITRF